MGFRRELIAVALTAAALNLSTRAWAQTPQPFPRPGTRTTAPTQPMPVQTTPPPTAAADPHAPTEAMLGFVIYPAAQFIASYDAGRGQRYYLFGATAAFTELVNFYRSVLKDRGDLVFEEPPTHMFEVGRFRDETMAFPPGVTIKDYTWGGSKGYPNPRRPASPERFPTIIMIVPAPAATAQGGLH
jgi:hypothetical protein